MGTPGHTDSQHTYHEVPAPCLCPLPCLRHQAWSRDLRRVQGRLTGPCGEADHRRLPGGAGRHPHCHPLVRDWTCEECTDILAKVAEFIKDPETVEKGVAYLQGECFCGQPDHTDDCNDLVSQLLPPAMEVLSGVLIETTTELCQDVVGVC